MDAAKISIIVPVYKVEPYLNKCVSSIVNQTYTNLEIILVDDGSPDNCPAMCDAWAEKDSRIRVTISPMVACRMPEMRGWRLLPVN